MSVWFDYLQRANAPQGSGAWLCSALRPPRWTARAQAGDTTVAALCSFAELGKHRARRRAKQSGPSVRRMAVNENLTGEMCGHAHHSRLHASSGARRSHIWCEFSTHRNQAHLRVLGDGLHHALRAGEAGRVERLGEAADGLRRGRHYALLLLLAGQLLRLVQLLPQLVVPAERPCKYKLCSSKASVKSNTERSKSCQLDMGACTLRKNMELHCSGNVSSG